jgi:hypothetical protein
VQAVYDEINRVYGSKAGEPPLGAADALHSALTCIARLLQLASCAKTNEQSQHHRREVCNMMVKVCVLTITSPLLRLSCYTA